jgi:hypothetical protein
MKFNPPKQYNYEVKFFKYTDEEGITNFYKICDELGAIISITKLETLEKLMLVAHKKKVHKQ